MISKLICYFRGHKKGKHAPEVPCRMRERAYRCPRCKATWARNIGVEKANAFLAKIA